MTTTAVAEPVSTTPAHHEEPASFLAASMRWNRTHGRMERVVIEVDPHTDAEKVIARVMRDGSSRGVNQSGFNGARRVVCEQVDVPFVRCLTPKGEKDQPFEGDATDAKKVFEAITRNVSMRREWSDDGTKLIEGKELAPREAERRYGQVVYTVCPETSTN